MKLNTLNEVKGTSKRNTSIKGRLHSSKQPGYNITKKLISYPQIINPSQNSLEEKNMISEKELLIQERYQLKENINCLNEELSKFKSENVHISLLLSQRENELEEIISVNPQQKEKIMQSIIISKLKAQYKDQSNELDKKNKEICELKKEKGYCHEKELKIENAQLNNQLFNMTELLNYTNNALNSKTNDGPEMLYAKEMITKQHCIIRVFEEKQKENERERRANKKEMEEMSKKVESKKVAIVKLENDLKEMKKLLKRTLKEEVNHNDWISEKKEYQKQFKEMEESLNYYKNKSAKNPQIIKSTKNESNTAIGKNCNNNTMPVISQRPPIQSFNIPSNPEESRDKQILLLQSIIKELRQENKELKATITFYEEQARPLKQSTSTPKNPSSLNSKKEENNNKINIQFEDILLINLSAKNINKSNAKGFFSMIVNNDNINETTQEDVISKITDTISIILGCSTNKKDKDAIKDFYNKMYTSDDIDNFENNFYDFLNKTNDYQLQDNNKEEMTKIINEVLNKHSDAIDGLIKHFPDTITIQNLMNIFSKNNIDLSKELVLFLLYQMKCALALESFISQDSSLNQLKTIVLGDYIKFKNEKNMAIAKPEEKNVDYLPLKIEIRAHNAMIIKDLDYNNNNNENKDLELLSNKNDDDNNNKKEEKKEDSEEINISSSHHTFSNDNSKINENDYSHLFVNQETPMTENAQLEKLNDIITNHDDSYQNS